MDKAKMRELEIQDEMKTCVHFTGIHKEVCKAGVTYKTVYDYPPELEDSGIKLALPCLSEKHCRKICGKAEFLGYEDAAKEVDRQNDAVDAYIQKLLSKKCPIHNISVTEIQVGKCVYSKECGCRLYQGKIKQS